MLIDDNRTFSRLPATNRLEDYTDLDNRELIVKDIDDARTASVSVDRCVALFIMGIREQLCFDKSIIITLGRLSEQFVTDGIFDLSPYNAHERGVSRLHCQLSLNNDQLYLTDLGSSNGTFLNGRRLTPNQPVLIEKRNRISLARLPIKLITQ